MEGFHLCKTTQEMCIKDCCLGTWEGAKAEDTGDGPSQEDLIGSCSVALPHTSLLRSAPRNLPHAFLSLLSPEPHHVSLADVFKLCLMKCESKWGQYSQNRGDNPPCLPPKQGGCWGSRDGVNHKRGGPGSWNDCLMLQSPMELKWARNYPVLF